MPGLVLGREMNVGLDSGPVQSCAVVVVPGLDFGGNLPFLESIVCRYVLTSMLGKLENGDNPENFTQKLFLTRPSRVKLQ